MRENLIFDSLPGRAGQGKGMVKWLGHSVAELSHLTQHLSDQGVVVLLYQVKVLQSYGAANCMSSIVMYVPFVIS